MVRNIALIIIMFFGAVQMNAQDIWNVEDKTSNFIISLETGQGWAKWPVPTFAPNTKFDGTTENNIESVYWGPGSDRMTRLTFLYRKNRLKLGGGVQQDGLSIQRYDSTVGYSGTNLLTFSTLSFYAQAEYHLLDIGPLTTSISARVGKYFSTSDNADVLGGTTTMELGMPFEFLLTHKLGFVFQPSVGIRNIKYNEGAQDTFTAKQYGLTGGLRYSF